MASILVQKRFSASAAARDGKPRRKSSGFAAADKRSVLVVQLVGDVARPRLRGDEFHFADQGAAPGFVDLRAELALHFFQLFPPGLAVGRDFQASLVAAYRTRVPRQSFSHHAGPDAGEPRDRGLRTLQFTQHATQKISRAFHGSRILAHIYRRENFCENFEREKRIAANSKARQSGCGSNQYHAHVAPGAMNDSDTRNRATHGNC